MIDTEKLIKCVFPYYGYLDECGFLMSILSEETRMIYHDNLYEFHRLFKKRTLCCHYPLFERMLKVLNKNYRWAQYRLDIQIKFPKDFSHIQDFIESHCKTDEQGNILGAVEFSSLHFVVTEVCIESANDIVRSLKDLKLIDMQNPESYSWLDVSNYSRVSNMATNLLFESDMVIGAQPEAFFDKTEEAGRIDVRKVNKCPYDKITFPVHALTTDADFCFEIGKETKVLHEVLVKSVNKVIIDDKLATIISTYEEILEHLKTKFFELRNVELILSANKTNEEDIITLFSDDIVDKIEVQSEDDQQLIEITAKNIYFAVGSNSKFYKIKAENFSIQFIESSYKKVDDLLIIDPSQANFSVSKLERQEKGMHYSDLEELKIENTHIILHSKFVQNVQFINVISEEHQIIPTHTFKLYLDEREEYEALTYYLNLLPDSIPVTLELDMALIENLEASKAITELIFQKNLVKLDIIMEMHYSEYVDFIYELIKQKKSIVEITPILHMSCKKTIDLMDNGPHVKQWILDVRLPNENLQESIREIIHHKTNTKFVLRDVHEFLIECRFNTSFEISPMF